MERTSARPSRCWFLATFLRASFGSSTSRSRPLLALRGEACSLRLAYVTWVGRVLMVQPDVRICLHLTWGDRETETDPVGHYLHVTGCIALYPAPEITQPTRFQPQLDAALPLECRPRFRCVCSGPHRDIVPVGVRGNAVAS